MADLFIVASACGSQDETSSCKDERPDGYIDGVNSFGLGGQILFGELRRLLGPDKLLQVDSNYWLSFI